MLDLQKYRGAVVFAASFVGVYLLCCVPVVGLLVGFVGRVVVASLVGVAVSFFLKSQLDRLFAAATGEENAGVDPARRAVFISGCDTGFG